MVEGNSHIHHQQPLCPVNAVLCPSQRADLETSTGSPRGKLKTTNTLHCLSPKARDDKTPSKTNLGVEAWSCTWAANKIHKEGPILKASEEAGPLMATAPRSWRKANTRLCKYEMTTEGKYEENENPKQTQDIRCSRMQSIRCYTHTLTFSLKQDMALPLHRCSSKVLKNHTDQKPIETTAFPPHARGKRLEL